MTKLRKPHLSAKLVSQLVSRSAHMSTWPVQDAKARFSEFLDACLAEGPQLVTRRGAEAAVLRAGGRMAAAAGLGAPVAQAVAAGRRGPRRAGAAGAWQGAPAHACGACAERHVPAGHECRLRAAQAEAAWRRAGLAALGGRQGPVSVSRHGGRDPGRHRVDPRTGLRQGRRDRGLARAGGRVLQPAGRWMPPPSASGRG